MSSRRRKINKIVDKLQNITEENELKPSYYAIDQSSFYDENPINSNTNANDNANHNGMFFIYLINNIASTWCPNVIEIQVPMYLNVLEINNYSHCVLT